MEQRHPGHVLEVVDVPAIPEGTVRIRSADGTCAYEIRWDVNRLTGVAAIRDAEGCDVALLHERITPNGRAVVVDRPGRAPCTVIHRRIAGGGSALVARDERSVVVSENVAVSAITFLQDGEAIAHSTRRQDESYRVHVSRQASAPLVLAVLTGLELLRAGGEMLAASFPAQLNV